MTQCKITCCQPDDLCSIPGSHTGRTELTSNCSLLTSKSEPWYMYLHTYPCTFIVHSHNNKWIKIKFKCDYWHWESHRQSALPLEKSQSAQHRLTFWFTHITNYQDTQSSGVRMERKAGKASQIRKSSEWTVVNGWVLTLFKPLWAW